MISIVRKVALLALGLSFASALPAWGWGETGHRIVADIADKYLNAKARAQVTQLLHGETLASVANFADVYRNSHTNSAPWHFVDIPMNATSYDPQRDCTAQGGCVIEQLELFKKQLADAATTEGQREFALKFVVHLVGDLHQPLHCVDNNDRGGNDVKVTFFGETKKSAKSSTRWNLHSVWDDGLIKRSGLSEEEYVQTLTAKLQPLAIKNLQAGTTIEWAMQSHQNAIQFAYKFPANNNLDQSYYQMAKPILDASLLRGGVRLARVLNETLGK